MNELLALSCLLDHLNSAADFSWGLMSFAICFLLGTFNGDTPPRIVFFVFLTVVCFFISPGFRLFLMDCQRICCIPG